MLRIGIATWNFEGDFVGKLRKFAQMGYDAASINGRLLDTISEDEEMEACRIAADLNILFTFHDRLVRDDGARAPDRAKRVLRWHERTRSVACLSFDVPHIRTPDGRKRANPEPILPILDEIATAFDGTGVRIAMEDCPIDVEHLEYLNALQEKHSHLGVLIDLGHMNLRLRDQKPPGSNVEAREVKNYIQNVPWEIVELHVHSNDGTRDQHAPPYFANADLQTAVCALSEKGFSGISTIELVPGWCGLTQEEAFPAAKKSLEYWRELLLGQEWNDSNA